MLGSLVCGHNDMWVQLYVGTMECGHKCVGTKMCTHLIHAVGMPQPVWCCRLHLVQPLTVNFVYCKKEKQFLAKGVLYCH